MNASASKIEIMTSSYFLQKAIFSKQEFDADFAKLQSPRYLFSGQYIVVYKLWLLTKHKLQKWNDKMLPANRDHHGICSRATD